MYSDQTMSSTIDHRTWRAGLPVRSAVLKPCAGWLVVGWVTTSEYRLLIVFFFLVFFFISIVEEGLLQNPERIRSSYLECGTEGGRCKGLVMVLVVVLLYSSNMERPWFWRLCLKGCASRTRDQHLVDRRVSSRFGGDSVQSRSLFLHTINCMTEARDIHSCFYRGGIISLMSGASFSKTSTISLHTSLPSFCPCSLSTIGPRL